MIQDKYRKVLPTIIFIFASVILNTSQVIHARVDYPLSPSHGKTLTGINMALCVFNFVLMPHHILLDLNKPQQTTIFRLHFENLLFLVF